MNRFLQKSINIVAFILIGMNSAHAIECQDPAWTQAISEAMGRAPKAGECNAKLYGHVRTHEERVQVARKTLSALYASRGGDAIATQKLPLDASKSK